MTTVEKIKAKILDLAIRGKLVPQNPDDEPASVLLERIKAEKAKLVKAGKIKKDKKPSEIVVGSDGATYEKFADGKEKDISEEIPFELPQGWAWARLADLTDSRILNDGDWIVSSDMSDNGGVKLLQLGSVGYGVYVDKGFKHITESKYNELGCTAIHPGYLLINRMIGDNLLACILPTIEGKIITAVDICWVAPSQRYDIKWVLFVVLSHWFQKVAKSLGAGEGRVRISKGNLIKIVFPLPPLAEQKRIVAKIEELFAYADKIGKASDGIAQAAQRIDKKILDLAIRGQLVPQDPNDEPASELIKRIEAAKKATAKGRKSSRIAASDRPPYEIEPPFDIPDSWEWVQLNDLGRFVGGHTPSIADSSNWENGNILWVTSKDMKQKYISNTGCMVTEKGASELHLLPPGSLLMVTRSGILRRTFPIALAAKPLTINQDQRALEFYDNNIGEYIYYCLKSLEPIVLRDYRKTGTTVESIIWEKFIHIPIPLPPINEQRRIVAKVEEFKAMIRNLVNS